MDSWLHMHYVAIDLLANLAKHLFSCGPRHDPVFVRPSWLTLPQGVPSSLGIVETNCNFALLMLFQRVCISQSTHRIKDMAMWWWSCPFACFPFFTCHTKSSEAQQVHLPRSLLAHQVWCCQSLSGCPSLIKDLKIKVRSTSNAKEKLEWEVRATHISYLVY